LNARLTHVISHDGSAVISFLFSVIVLRKLHVIHPILRIAPVSELSLPCNLNTTKIAFVYVIVGPTFWSSVFDKREAEIIKSMIYMLH
jgi:hypothetical protein